MGVTFLKRLYGLSLKIAVALGIIVAIKFIPSLLWPDQKKSLVRDEGYQAGHYTIGINERMIRKEADALLFSTLKKWRYERERPTPAPKDVMEADNAFVQITGFMYPLESGPKIKQFCLLRSTQTCCYGPRPQYNQYVLVEMDEPTAFVRLEPVQVAGVFHVEPKPEDGYIYRLEGKTAGVITRKK